MRKEYFLVYYGKELVNVVQSDNWVDACRTTANTREDKDWKNYDSKWLHPKFYKRHGIEITEEKETGDGQ